VTSGAALANCQPTATTTRSPAFCAESIVTNTELAGFAAFLPICTNVIGACASALPSSLESAFVLSRLRDRSAHSTSAKR